MSVAGSFPPSNVSIHQESAPPESSETRVHIVVVFPFLLVAVVEVMRLSHLPKCLASTELLAFGVVSVDIGVLRGNWTSYVL